MGRIASGRSDIFKIEPDKIAIDPGWNCRDFHDPENIEHVQRLKESIRTKGVQEPLTVRIEDGNPLLTNGECRLRAVLELRKDGHDIPVVPVQTEHRGATNADWIESQITRNSGKPFTPFEQARVFARLKELGRTEAEIAGTAGLTAERVRQLLLLNKATEPTKALVRDGRVSATTVQRAIEREKDPEKAEKAVTKAAETAASEGRQRATPRHLKASAPDDNSDLLGSTPAPKRQAKRDFRELLSEVVSFADETDDEGNVVARIPPGLWNRIKDVSK